VPNNWHCSSACRTCLQESHDSGNDSSQSNHSTEKFGFMKCVLQIRLRIQNVTGEYVHVTGVTACVSCLGLWSAFVKSRPKAGIVRSEETPIAKQWLRKRVPAAKIKQVTVK
jgi:hypothetical protein